MLPGDVIDGRFEIERRVGPTGAVYRALDRRTDAHAAVKVVPSPDARFARAADLLVDLRAPAIVATLAHGRTAGGDGYVAMEWLEGEDLGARLANGELGPADAIGVAEQAAEALVAAHAAGVVHGAIDPSAVFLVDFRIDAVKLIGFGVGRAGEPTRADDVAALGALVARMTDAAGPLADLVSRMQAPDPARRPAASAVLADLRALAGRDDTTPMATPRRGRPVAAVAPTGLVGRTLGDFVVKEKIGEGGFGDVYRAEQPALGREAVIKVLHGQLRAREPYAQRFLREARLASKLDHPFAAHVYAFGAEPDGQMWIAMELVRGTPLDRLLAANGPIALERFVPLLDRICEVVQGAHEAGIVHRDLKPANVMVIARAGRLLPKLLDFGIAKLHGDPADAAGAAARAAPAAGELTEDGVAMGSPSYMAPELWGHAAAADARSDLYALGVLAFECLMGKPPFRARDRATIARAHASERVPPLAPHLPRALDAVLARAMAKNPADRWADALAFAAAFREAAGFTASPESLPRLDETLLRDAVAGAPQPIAEAVAALDGARNPHQAREAVWEIVHVTIHYLGACALACRTRVGPGGASDAPAVADRLRSLRRKDLDETGWLELARELVRPFAGKRAAHPMPELVELFFAGDDRAAPLERLARLRGDEAPGSISHEDKVRDELDRLLPELARALRAVAFLWDYRLVVPRAGGADVWMGIRRARPATTALLGPPLPDGRPILADADGRPVVSLAPIVQVAPPTAGAPDELFLFEGRGRAGARLVAMPHGFERQDEGVWDWFRASFAADAAAGAEAAAAEVAPYRGLAAFTTHDAAAFLGRERQVDDFTNRLRTQPLVAVVGPSGAGKTSLVQAGVIPALPDWRAITVRPGPAPLATLAARLAEDGIALDPADLGASLRAAAAAPHAPILLVVDQLEELFTLCKDPAERRAYADALARAARSADDRVRVVLTLRDDFLVRAAELPGLRDRLAHGLQLITTPAAEDLLRILVEPARRAGYDFDDRDLPARMVAAVADQPGALALLSFTAEKLWDLRDRHFRQLPRKAYDAMGGVGGALARHAEDTLAQLTAEEGRLVREAFRHLVTAEGTRATMSRDELGQVLGDAAAADGVVEKLVRARLLVASEDDRIEVIHEALLGAWPRLVAWRRDDAEGARLRDQVRAAARQWDERGRPRGLLWRQEALAEYQLWRARYPGALTEVEEAFGRASANDAARGRRARRGIVVAIVLALGAGVIVLYQANRRARDSAAALHERLVDAHEEQGRQAFLAGDAERALLYFNEAHKQGRDTVALRYLVARAEEALVPKLPAFHHDDRVWSVAFSPDGKRVVTGSADRTARLWDVATGARALTLEHKDVVYAVAFSPDGTTLATASWDGSARLWDAATGALRHELGHAGRVYAVRFSRDGTRLVTPSRDATAKVWDAATGALVTTLAPHPAQVDDVDISPDGERILTACRDGAVRVWARDGRLAAVLPAGHGHVAVAAFSPDGARIVTVGDGSDAAVVWDAATGRELASLVHPNHVWDARWGPRGRLLTSSADGRARVWDVAAGTTMTVLEGHQGIVYAAAFTPDGTKIVTAGEDGTIRVWEVDVAKVTAVYEAGEVHLPLVMDPTGTHFVVGNVGAAQLWRMPDEKLHRTFRAHAGEAWTCAFSPDDARILTTGEDDALRVWDARTARLAGEMAFDRAPHTAGFSPDGRRAVVGFWLPTGARESTAVLSVVDLDARTRVLDLAGHTADVTHAEYSHDGARILSSSKDGTARIWDARSGAPLATIAAGESLAVARFSPDDRRALTGGAGATAALWDARDGRPLVRLEGHELAITLAAFSPDGAWALTGGNDKTAIVWDAATGRRAGSLVGHRSGLLWGEFTPDGQLAVTAARDGARIWDVATGRMLQALPHSGGVGGAAFSHDGRRLVVVSDDGTADVWETGVGPLDGLDRFVRCAVPLRLEAERIVPAAPICG